MSKFSRPIGLLILALLAPNSHAADSPSACAKQVLQNQGWTANISAAQADCIAVSMEFETSAAGLCSPDKSDLSPHYQAFAKYDTDLKQAYDIFLHSTDVAVRAEQQMKIQQLKTNIMLFGHEDEISGYLLPLYTARDRCTGNI